MAGLPVPAGGSVDVTAGERRPASDIVQDLKIYRHLQSLVYRLRRGRPPPQSQDLEDVIHLVALLSAFVDVQCGAAAAASEIPTTGLDGHDASADCMQAVFADAADRYALLRTVDALRNNTLAAGRDDPWTGISGLSVRYFPAYGASLLSISSIGAACQPVVHFRVIALDNWVMKIHPVDGTNRSYDSVPQSFQTLDAGYCPLQQLSVVQAAFKRLLNEAQSNIGDARAAGRGTDMRRGHQKTAALILSILVDAIRTAAMLADPSQDDPQELAELIEDPDEFPDALNDVRERPTQPRGCFTDVGQHTGGHPRCTTWPLVHHTFLALLQEQPLEHDTETTPATPADILHSRLFTMFHLWLLESEIEAYCSYPQRQFVAAADTCGGEDTHRRWGTPATDPDAIDAIMLMLDQTVDVGEAFTASFTQPQLMDFVHRCTVVRQKLEIAVSARAEAIVRNEFTLRHFKNTTEALEGYRSPVVDIPALEAPIRGDGDDSGRLDAMRRRADGNLAWLPPFQPPAQDEDYAHHLVPQLDAWVQQPHLCWGPKSIKSTAVVADFRAAILVVETLQEQLFQLALLSLRQDATSDDTALAIEDRHRAPLVKLAEEHAARVEAILGDCSRNDHLRLQQEVRSKRVLVRWVVYCLLHRSNCTEYPLLRAYSVALHHEDLQHLVLGDRHARDTLLCVADYLRRNSTNERSVAVFSTRPEEAYGTAKFARELAEKDATLQEVLQQERKEQEERIDARCAQIQRQKNRLAELDPQLRTKLNELSSAESSRNGQRSADTANWHDCPHFDHSYGTYARHPHVCEHTNGFKICNTRCNVLEKEISTLRNEIEINERPPPPLYQPLPKERAGAWHVLAFLQLPLPLRLLAGASYSAQSALMGGAPVEVPNVAGLEPWTDHYNKFSKRTHGAALFTTVMLDHEKEEKPKIGSNNVRDISDREDGIWWPDSWSCRMAWPSHDDPFSPTITTRAVIESFTETLSKPSQRLQVFMPMLPAAPKRLERGNLAIADQAKKPALMGKEEYLCFAALRAHPCSQWRRLAGALADRTLSMARPAVKILVRQLVYHVGELQMSTGELEMKWLGDWRQGGLLPMLRSTLDDMAEALVSAPKDHADVPLVSELVTFLTDYDHDSFAAIRDKMAAFVLGWARQIDKDIAESEQNGGAATRGLRARQCVFLHMALLCYRLGPLSDENVGQILRLLALAHNRQPLNEDKKSIADERLVDQLHTLSTQLIACRSVALMQQVLGAADKDAMITGAVREIMQDAPADLRWNRCATAADCVEAVATDANGHIALYSFNILTGVFLLCGSPPKRLPAHIVANKIYERTFGTRNFEVLDCAPRLNGAGGMRTTRKIGGRFYEFHGDTTTDRLLVFEVDINTDGGADGEVLLEMLPVADKGVQWCAELPVRLHDLHSHWLCRQHNAVVLRPVSYLGREADFIIQLRWPPSAGTDGRGGRAEAWVYKVPAPQRRRDCGTAVPWRYICATIDSLDRLLIPAGQPCEGDTNDTISGPSVETILAKFEEKRFIHIFLSPAESPSHGVSALLRFAFPRYDDLSFRLEVDGRLHSLAHKELVLCHEQQLRDTLHGFYKYLVLETSSRTGNGGAPQLHLLVPDGDVQRPEPNSIVMVSVSGGVNDRHKYHTYHTHARFRRLEAKSLEGRLQLAALYAATSTLLPDGRNCMTGAEVAIVLLRYSWVDRLLRPREWTHLNSVYEFSASTPALALLCADLAESSEQKGFLWCDEANPERSHRQPLPRADAATEYRLDQLSGRRNFRHRLWPDEAKRLLIAVPSPRAAATVAGAHPGNDSSVWNVYSPNIPATAVRDAEMMLTGWVQPAAGWTEGAPPQDRLFPLEDMMAKQGPLGRELLEELKESWLAEQQLRPARLRDAVESGGRADRIALFAGLARGASPSLSSAVGHMLSEISQFRAAAQQHVESLLAVGLHADSRPFVLRRLHLAANRVTLATESDVVRLTFTDPALLLEAINPLLSTPRLHGMVQASALRWMELCVLEDRLHRLTSLCAQASAVPAGAGIAVMAGGEQRASSVLVRELGIHREWSPQEHPRWLAFEVTGGLQIRPVQYRLYRALRSREGAIEQLNMGLGKTRVLIPMLILDAMPKQGRQQAMQDAGCDALTLTRVHFLPQLLEEAFDYTHMLLCASELAVKLLRQPFHRDVDITLTRARVMQRSLQQAARFGGALFVAPEHRLSLKLRCSELRINGNEESVALASALRDVEAGPLAFMDVFDESDALLHTKYQLVYAHGTPRSMPGRDSRCNAGQALLRLMCRSTAVRGWLCPGGTPRKYVKEPPRGAGCEADDERVHGDHEYSVIQLMPGPDLQDDTRDFHECLARALLHEPPAEMEWIGRWVQDGYLAVENVVRCLIDPTVAFDDASMLTGPHPLEDSYRDHLLAVRGLLAHGTLVHSLTLRNRVDHGVDRVPAHVATGRRTKLSVPFRASQTPSERAEFSHSDLGIILTSLAYTSDGLSSDQCLEAFGILMGQNLHAQERSYNRWFELSKSAMQKHERQKLDRVAKVDITNSQVADLVVRYYARNSEVVFFYLNYVIFPEATRQFPHRLLATPWHLCDTGQPRSSRCGFSGTNDTRITLPGQVSQCGSPDPELRATNGKMLDMLLATQRPCTVVKDIKEALRSAIVDHKCHAFIDAGAIASSLSNEAVALLILALLEERTASGTDDSQKIPLKGVMYFDGGEWWLRRSEGRKWRRHAAPLPTEQAFVFFDESHTRGADFVLHHQARAMLTVGKRMMKDTLMQAAGRMRQLSKDGAQQTLVLAVVDEVAAKLRAVHGNGQGEALLATHVLRYVMDNTVEGLQVALPAWASQGIHFVRTTDRGAPPTVALEAERLELGQLYACASERQNYVDVYRSIYKQVVVEGYEELQDKIDSKVAEYGAECSLMLDLGAEVITVNVHEECERELQREQEQEQEQEREVQRYSPAAERNWDYESVKKAASVQELDPVCGAMSLKTFAAMHLPMLQDVRWDKNVYVSRNNVYPLSVTLDAADLGQYLRSVSAAILFPGEGQCQQVLLVSEHEAEQILAMAWKSHGNQKSLRNKPTTATPSPILTSVSILYREVPRESAVSTTVPPLCTYLTTGCPPSRKQWQQFGLSPSILTTILLFAGETNFRYDCCRSVLRGSVLVSTAAKHSAREILEGKGQSHHYAASDLETACKP